MEVDINLLSVPAQPIPDDSVLKTWKPTMTACTENAGYAANCATWMKQEIEAAGFSNVHELDFKLPTGDRPSHPV